MSTKKPAAARGKHSKAGAKASSPHSPPLVREMALEALKSWLVPSFALTAVALLWLLSATGVAPEPVAVVGIAGSLLALTLFASFRRYLFGPDATRRRLSWAFAVLWGALLFTQFYLFNYPGSPTANGTVRAGAGPIAIPSGHHALVVDGRFTAAQGEANRLGRYRLEVTRAGGEPQTINGNFQDNFARQRLGRRGSTVVEIQHTSERHLVDLPSPGMLRLVDVDPALQPELRFALYPASRPWVFPLLGVAGIVGIFAFEKWLDGDGSATMATVVSFFVVDQYMRWASPHPQLRSFIGAVLIGGIIGAPLAAVGWRFVPRRWIVRKR